MAKYYENSTVFQYSWEQVLQGFWKRYPNPYSLHVLSEDTIEREIRPDGKLYSKRVLTKTNRVPKWGERFFKAKFVCIIEESLVDPNEKTLTTHTRNIGFNKIMVRSADSCTLVLLIILIFPAALECRRKSRVHTRHTRQDRRPAVRLDRLPGLRLRNCNPCLRLWKIQEELPANGMSFTPTSQRTQFIRFFFLRLLDSTTFWEYYFQHNTSTAP